MITGRIAFSSKLPWLPAKATAESSPSTWMAIITIASHWVGLTLPGMIEEPGSFWGSLQFGEPGSGSGGQPAHVVGDLHQGHSEPAEGRRGRAPSGPTTLGP